MGSCQSKRFACSKSGLDRGLPIREMETASSAPQGSTSTEAASTGHFNLPTDDAFHFPPLTIRLGLKTTSTSSFLSELERHGLRPAGPAEKLTMIRRVTYDLTGLPPTPEEIETFLNDHSPDAYEKLIDRLLASPRYGERWGRFWLDVARYADSNGLDENIAHGNAWRYRDYVIASFNQDKPYDQFVLEQLAGDLLSPARHDANVANERSPPGFSRWAPRSWPKSTKPRWRWISSTSRSKRWAARSWV